MEGRSRPSGLVFATCARDRQQYTHYQKEMGLEEAGEGQGGTNGDGKRHELGGAHTIQYTNDAL